MEIIKIEPYIEEEKLDIAKKYLIPEINQTFNVTPNFI
jgi:ATP-dependent Lon protease